ncbi:transcriptional adapter 2-beta-like [Corticium candelabrum]|uniref:transcriptional adapter 2-beta-like n=1 Tax=Corticium candelabrum TaxID=121492 RepID=UPI002E26C122|nr:transcriptional adapter 2-beta-like [Corticium candelabrum]
MLLCVVRAVTLCVRVSKDEQRVLCCNCATDATLMHIQCHKCKDLLLCLQCFASGAELADHKRNHSYKIVNNGAFHVLLSNWSAHHDHALLEAIEQCGFANWIDTGHVLGRTAEESQKHFQETFVDGELGNMLPKDFHSKVLNKVGGEVPPVVCDPNVVAGSTDLTVIQQRDLGYMPERRLEGDNKAEGELNSLTIGVTETGLEAALRFVYPEAYLLKLREQDRKKRIIQQLRLVSSRQLSTIDSEAKQSTQADDVLSVLRPFARFLSHEEHEQLRKSVIRELQLKRQIEELVEYRENGITTLSASHDFKLARQRRERMREMAARRKSQWSQSPVRRASTSSASKRTDKVNKQDKELTEEISQMTGFEMLGHREQQVCTTLRMTPSRYTTLKGLMVKDHATRRKGMAVKTRYPAWLEKSHKKYIFNFLRDCGWLPTS